MAEAGAAEQLALLPDAPRPPRARRGLLVLAWALAGVFLVTTVLLAIVATDLKGDKDEIADDRQEVSETAARLVETVFSYDHTDVESTLYDGLELATGPLAAQIEAGLADQEGPIGVAQSTSVVTLQDVFVAEVEGDSATAIVVFDALRTGAAGERRERNIYVRLGLVRLEGGWRVSDLVNINLASLLSSPSAEAASTTTTTG